MYIPPSDPKYDDAPDEFAEFLDSKREYVFISELCGEKNPFVATGIYKRYDITSRSCAGCEFDDPENYDRDPEWCDRACANCKADIMRAKNDPTYRVNDMRLAEFISKGIGCTVCRQFKKTGWQFGKLRDHDVYFACNPTPGMYKALESTPKSVLIIGQNTPDIPSNLASRVIYLARLLYVDGASLRFDMTAIYDKIQSTTPPTRCDSKSEIPEKKHSRPPVQVYAPYYLLMIHVWLGMLRKEGVTGTPSFKWINGWMHNNCHIKGLKPVGERQNRRHVKALISESEPLGRLDNRSPTFAIFWNGCLSETFIRDHSEKDIAGLITNAFTVATKTGFKVSPMKGMDAAEYAEKVKTKTE